MGTRRSEERSPIVESRPERSRRSRSAASSSGPPAARGRQQIVSAMAKGNLIVEFECRPSYSAYRALRTLSRRIPCNTVPRRSWFATAAFGRRFGGCELNPVAPGSATTWLRRCRFGRIYTPLPLEWHASGDSGADELAGIQLFVTVRADPGPDSGARGVDQPAADQRQGGTGDLARADGDLGAGSRAHRGGGRVHL